MEVQLGSFLSEVNEKTTKNNQYPVLTSSKSGLYLQSEYFNKQVASKDNTGYKIIKRDQFTYRAMSDTGEFFPNILDCADVGIVSPAYPVFEISDKSVIIPEYLKYFFKSNGFQNSIASFAQGSTRTSVKFNKMRTVTINIPSIIKQQEIVSTLDKLQSIITHRRTQLEKLDLLVKARFVEMFGDPELNPYNWDKEPMGDYMTLLTDFSANGSYEYLDSNVKMYDEPNYALMVRTTDLERNDFVNEVKYIDENAYNVLSKSKVFGNEIIMNKIGSAGKIYLMPVLNRPVSLGRNVFMFRFNDKINIIFLYFLLISDYGKKEIQQHVRGAVTKTITKDAARSVRIIIPPLELQTQFANFVKQVDKSKVVLQSKLEKTQTLFDSLMQEYFG